MCSEDKYPHNPSKMFYLSATSCLLGHWSFNHVWTPCLQARASRPCSLLWQVAAMAWDPCCRATLSGLSSTVRPWPQTGAPRMCGPACACPQVSIFLYVDRFWPEIACLTLFSLVRWPLTGTDVCKLCQILMWFESSSLSTCSSHKEIFSRNQRQRENEVVISLHNATLLYMWGHITSHSCGYVRCGISFMSAQN